MEGQLRTTQGIRPGVIAFSLGFGHWSYGGVDFVVNTTLLDPVGGSAVFYDTHVKLVPAEAARQPRRLQTRRTRMSEDATGETVSLASWLEGLYQIIGAEAGAAITADEQAALLDIARIAAHGSERIAAPLSTFLAGVAYGALPSGERAAALRRLADRLEP